MVDDPVVIVGARRTPIGGFLGALSGHPAPALGAKVLEAVLRDTAIDPQEIDEVLMGCVLSAGVGMAPARQAALAAGVPNSVPCTTINKVCGSAMKAVMLAHDALMAGSGQIIIAGGMESMSNAPYLLKRARRGHRLGHGQVVDHIFLDGLEDAYGSGRLMGEFAEQTARELNISRDAQDDFAIRSLQRACQAQSDGRFAAEIICIDGTDGIVDADEQPRTADPSRIPHLKAVFQVDGTITAANASSISDGGVALMLMRKSEAARRNLNARAVIRAHASFAQQPSRYTTAPVGAVEKLIKMLSWTLSDVDLFEINEVF
ncbi:MAG: acetyl-CoA C-acyltransferase, partial [Magnetovibrio sp.]|nr:acetyl-CoA C-acyltransferase [Magnetovibrio sp.]